MTGQFPTATGKARHLLMEQAVVFDLTDERGQKVHGLCEKALYTYAASAATTNNMVELTGNPILETADATFQNRVIVLDRARNKLMAQGNYRVYGRAAAGTNVFSLPKR
ncbi:MAG: hypothetical protein DME25_14900 [Verrucomicrobia bacterium]|nr:MAG: hypothetical protein DME25_14900 [Verrucomicrobiota bacterium]